MENQPHGKGRVIYHDGEYYVGDWKHGKFDGEGRLHGRHLIYAGDWKEDLQVRFDVTTAWLWGRGKERWVCLPGLL